MPSHKKQHFGLKAGGEGSKGEDSSNFSMKSLSCKSPENTHPEPLDTLKAP